MAEGLVQVAPDSTGKKVRTEEIVVGANTVEQQVVTIAKSDGTLLDDLSRSSVAQPGSIADGSDVAVGATGDAAVTTNAAGTVSGKLRGIVALLAGGIAVSWAAAQHVILDASTAVIGHVIVDSGTITANAGTNLNTSALALDATITGGTAKAIARGGAKGTTTAADVTSTAEGANNNAIDVQLYHGGVAKDPTAIRALTSADVVTVAQGAANATPWNENLAQVGGSAVITSVAGAPGVGGDTADGATDAGKSVKVGGKVTLNSAALPTALTGGQRAPAMTDEYGRFRVIQNRPKIIGTYYFESGRLTVLAAAHAATAGFFWIINPVGSSVIVAIKKLQATSSPTAATAFVTAPRITVERVTFTGTASGAQITPAKRDSTDATNTSTIRTASTGLTLTAGAVLADFLVSAILTAVGIAVPVEQSLYEATRDDDDSIVLRAGEGIVIRQADAGSTSDTRLFVVSGSLEER